MSDGKLDGPLEALAARFTVPAKSGVYLTKSELLLLARASEASLRINERPRMLTDILKSTQSLEELEALLKRLIDFCRLHVEFHEGAARAYPVAAPLVAPWVEKARATMVWLEETIEELQLAARS